MAQRQWLKTYCEMGIPAEIDANAFRSVVDLLEQTMVKYADRPAFHSFGQTLTFSDVDRRSRHFAAFLQKRLGVRKGDRIAVMIPNLIAFPIAFLGIIRAGAIQVSVNPLYTARELEHQLNDAGVKILIAYAGSTAAVADVMNSTPLQTVVTVEPGDGGGAKLDGPQVDPRLSSAVSFADALVLGASLPFDCVDLNGDDLLLLQYTGGTTGLSKGAMLSHRNLVANTEQFKAGVVGATRAGKEVVVTAIPLYHIFALMVNFITYFSVGAENWLVANLRDIDGLISALNQARPSIFMGVNTLYAGLVAHPKIGDVDFSNLRLAGGGGAAIIPAVSAKWRAITGQIIREGYGLSETSPILTFNPTCLTEFSATAGLPLPSTDVKLLDEDGREARAGAAGEICARGPQVMSGYWQKPDANTAAFTAEGYFRTGDVGVFDESGFLKIVDRKKDMIIVSGFKVYPNEVEAVATACPGVHECACIGVFDAKSGEAVKLFVVRAADAETTADDIRAHCRREMAAYKAPKHVLFVDALPKSAVGKLLRRKLREEASDATR